MIAQVGNADRLTRMPTYDTNFGAKRAREARERFGLDDSSPVRLRAHARRDSARNCRSSSVACPITSPARCGATAWERSCGSTRCIPWSGSASRSRTSWGTSAAVTPRPRSTPRRSSPGTRTSRVRCRPTRSRRSCSRRARVCKAMVERDPGLEDVVRLAAHFGISTVAALYRCSTLGLVSSRRYEQLRREIDEDLHREVWDYLRPDTVHDVLSRDRGLPAAARVAGGLGARRAAARRRSASTPPRSRRAARLTGSGPRPRTSAARRPGRRRTAGRARPSAVARAPSRPARAPRDRLRSWSPRRARRGTSPARAPRRA